MTTKPPTGLEAIGHSDGPEHDVEDLSDELVVDSSPDFAAEASDDSGLDVEEQEPITATKTPAPTPAPLFTSLETPPPVTTDAAASYRRRSAPTLLGMPMPSLPLPGSSAHASTLGLGEDQHDVSDDDDEEVTVMARPSVTDDEEEATKVEPAETAIRAAASREEDDEDELTAALSTQASVERERALRKSMPPSLDMPLSAHSFPPDESLGGDFDDSAEMANDDDVALAGETPGVALDDEESATDTYSAESEASELEAVLAPRRPTSPTGSSALGGAAFGAAPFSASTPVARSDSFGGRLPTPSGGIGLTLPPSPSPSQPPPAASPFSSRLGTGGVPYPRSMSAAPTGSMPALQIPAPSGAVTVSNTAGIFRNVQLPLGGLVASCLACLVGGLVIGGKFLGTRAPAPAPVVAAAPAPRPAAPAPTQAQTAPPIVAAPSPAPAPAAPAAHVAAAPAPKPQPAQASPKPTPPAATPAPAEPGAVAAEDGAKPAVKRAARPAAARKVATNTGDAPATKPRPKVAKGWVDPFAD